MRGAGIAAALLSLSACSWLPGFVHRQEGGEIAKPQPTPPGLNKPYPNLASVPARPPAPDRAKLEALSNSLIAARENQQTLLVQAPPDPSLPSTAPQLFGVGTVPPPAPAPPPPPPPGGAAASLAAVNGPAAPQPPAAKPAPPPAAPPAIAAAPSAAAAASPAPPPAMSAAPPPPPRLADAGPIPALAAPPPPSRAVRAEPLGRTLGGLATSTNPADLVQVAFPAGSAILPADAASALKSLAARRGGHPIAVIGHGDAAGLAPTAQGNAVGLGLERAQAMAQALAADGVPDAAIRIGSEAEGRGGVARILE